MNQEPNLGTCCACEGTTNVRNIIMLNKKAPITGKGWGCLECKLPSDGACFVLCDACVEAKALPRFACRGYPGVDGRLPFDELTGLHEHDMSKHAEEAEEPPAFGSKVACDRCACCQATLTRCEECEGKGELFSELLKAIGADGHQAIQCASCEGVGGFMVCDGGCDFLGEHLLNS